jgi:hypothetical protein
VLPEVLVGVGEAAEDGAVPVGDDQAAVGQEAGVRQCEFLDVAGEPAEVERHDKLADRALTAESRIARGCRVVGLQREYRHGQGQERAVDPGLGGIAADVELVRREQLADPIGRRRGGRGDQRRG